MERRLRLEDISKQSGWGNSSSNPTDGKLMHIYFYRNYILLKSDIHLNGCVMCNDRVWKIYQNKVGGVTHPLTQQMVN